MAHLRIEDVMELLDVQTIPGKPWQLERKELETPGQKAPHEPRFFYQIDGFDSL